MATIGIRDLARNVSKIIEQVQSTGRPIVVTRHGQPVAALVGVDLEALEDFILANAPEYVRAMAEADRDLARRRTVPATELLG